MRNREISKRPVIVNGTGDQPERKPYQPTRPHHWLPYGRWVTADGTEILYNRGYQPIFEKRRGEKLAQRVERYRHVEHVSDSRAWWTDFEHPLRDRRTVRFCLNVLRDFGVSAADIHEAETLCRVR